MESFSRACRGRPEGGAALRPLISGPALRATASTAWAVRRHPGCSGGRPAPVRGAQRTGR